MTGLQLRNTVSKTSKAKLMEAVRESPGSGGLSQEAIDKIDPFTYTPPFTHWQRLLVVFNALWLGPIRLVFIVLPSFFLGTISCLLALIGDRYDHDNPTPLGRWGRFVHRVSPFLCRWFLFGFGFHWIHVKGTVASSKEAPILVVGPHTSMLDVFVMVLFGVPTFVAREETRHTPLFGPLITRTVRAIYVSREDPKSRMKSAEEIQRRTSSQGSWPHVLIYPEGTTTNRQVLLKYKPGAFSPGLPVQPVLIKYRNKLNTTSWGGDGVGLVGTLFYTICQFHNSLEVEFMPVYQPSQTESEDPRLYANNVQELMSRNIGIPAGNQSIEDLMLMRHARSLGMPFSKGMVVYYNPALRDTGLVLSDMKKLMTRYSAMDRDKDGLISVGDLAHFLQVPNDSNLQAIFNHCNKEPGGKVSFANYLSGLVKKSRSLLEDQQFTQDMFNFFDTDNDGKVSVGELPAALVKPTVARSRRDPTLIQPEDDIDIENFKSLLSEHPEYVVLFEQQESGHSQLSESSSKQFHSPSEISPSFQQHSNGVASTCRT